MSTRKRKQAADEDEARWRDLLDATRAAAQAMLEDGACPHCVGQTFAIVALEVAHLHEAMPDVLARIDEVLTEMAQEEAASSTAVH
jgi:hypothetical protein